MHVSILVPSFTPSGPVRGAAAFANALVERTSVDFVALRPGPGIGFSIASDVRQITLAPRSMLGKTRAYRDLLRSASSQGQVVSLSLCFSADMVNLLCRDLAFSCSSVRGNLIQNYLLDYGAPGVPLALFHLFSERFFHQPIAMSDAMANQVARLSGVRPLVLPNFVDEASLERHRAPTPPAGPPYRLVFVGSLSRRKKPLELVSAVSVLRGRGFDVELDIVGEGPMAAQVSAQIVKLGLGQSVRLHGFVIEPYSQVATVHALVLPSVSEGLPRAALEALYLGTPVVVRDVDGNAELVHEGINGALFADDAELPDAIVRALKIVRRSARGTSLSLLLPKFRQKAVIENFLEFVSRHA